MVPSSPRRLCKSVGPGSSPAHSHKCCDHRGVQGPHSAESWPLVQQAHIGTWWWRRMQWWKQLFHLFGTEMAIVYQVVIWRPTAIKRKCQQEKHVSRESGNKPITFFMIKYKRCQRLKCWHWLTRRTYSDNREKRINLQTMCYKNDAWKLYIHSVCLKTDLYTSLCAVLSRTACDKWNAWTRCESKHI